MQTSPIPRQLQRIGADELIHAFRAVALPEQHLAFTLEHALGLLLHLKPAEPLTDAGRDKLAAAICSAFARAFRQPWGSVSPAELTAALHAALRRVQPSAGLTNSGYREIKLIIYCLRAELLREDIGRDASRVERFFPARPTEGVSR